MNTISENQESNSLFNKEIHPFLQAGTALLICLLAMGIGSTAVDGKEGGSVFYWEAAFSVLMGFALFNAVLSIPYKKRTSYFRDSIFCFIAVGAISGYLAYLFSGLGVDEAGSFRWLYVVFTFTYLVFISIVNAMRKIIEIAKKQDARLRGEDL